MLFNIKQGILAEEPLVNLWYVICQIHQYFHLQSFPLYGSGCMGYKSTRVKTTTKIICGIVKYHLCKRLEIRYKQATHINTDGTVFSTDISTGQCYRGTKL